jgi:hypothetical protein
MNMGTHYALITGLPHEGTQPHLKATHWLRCLVLHLRNCRWIPSITGELLDRRHGRRVERGGGGPSYVEEPRASLHSICRDGGVEHASMREMPKHAP